MLDDEVLLDNTDDHEQASSDDVQAPTESANRHRASPVRWYVLLVYTCMAGIQGYIWNMWGPIYASIRQVFDWDQQQLAMMPLYGAAPMVVLCMPSAYVLRRCGLRLTTVAMAALTFVAAVIKCVHLATNASENWLLNISAAVNGVGGVPIFMLPPLISAVWFPDRQRKLATAIAQLANSFGTAAPYLIGPMAVPEPQAEVPESVIRSRYFYYTYAMAAFTAVTFGVILVYFPSQPSSAPSASAETVRVNFLQSVKMLLTSWTFWLILVVLCFTNGSFAGWFPVLQLDFQSHGMDQNCAGEIGFWSAVVGIAIGLAMGMCGDFVGQGSLKVLILALCFLAALGSCWWFLLAEGILMLTVRQAYISTILFGATNVAITPLIYELAAEHMFPIDEGVTSGLLTVFTSLWVSVFFLIAMAVQNNQWINYVLAITSVFAVVLTFFIGEKHDDNYVITRSLTTEAI